MTKCNSKKHPYSWAKLMSEVNGVFGAFFLKVAVKGRANTLEEDNVIGLCCYPWTGELLIEVYSAHQSFNQPFTADQ